MLLARQRALAVRASRRVVGGPDDATLDGLLADADLTVVEGCPFTGRVREVYAAGLLGIRAGTSPEWTRWLKGHGLGHHLLHRGNHLYSAGGLHLWQRQEIEAELFAGTLFFGPASPLDISALAEMAAVPRECVRSWQASFLHFLEERPGPSSARFPRPRHR